MDLGLKNKKVLVVGVGLGIGKSVVESYLEEGAKVFAIARSKRTLEAVEIREEYKANYFYYTANLMIPGTPTQIITKILEEELYFDIVVHNIGGPMGIRDPLAPVGDWNKVWQLNIGIAIEMNTILFKPMIARSWGRIIHISSISAKILRGSPQYCCAKAYVNAYVKTVGRELADKGVVVSAILPGAVEFEKGYWAETKHSNKEKYYGYLKEHQSINRYGYPQEIANFVLFMGSNKVDFAPGALIPVDGGNK